MEPMTDTMTAEPKQKMSRTMRWAMAHPFMIYEVTDPELRSLLCYYRNKDKRKQQEQTQNQEACNALLSSDQKFAFYREQGLELIEY